MVSYNVDGICMITPLRLEDRRVGRYFITAENIKAHTPVTIISARNAFIGGMGKQLKAHFDCDLRVHRLRVGPKKIHPQGDVWTSDHPQEIYSQAVEFRNCHGHVLVGGLGIGMAAVMLATLPQVKSITVVEISRDVIRLIQPQIPATSIPIKIVHADLYKYLKDCPDFDSAYFDIWASTGERVWIDQVVPLRRLVYRYHGKKPVFCWLEREMIGQVRSSVQMMSFVKEMAKSKATMIEAWKHHCRSNHAYFSVADGKSEAEQRSLLTVFVSCVGTEAWERTFGEAWDSWRQPRRRLISRCHVDERAGALA